MRRLILVSLLLCSLAVRAALVEEVTKLPVSVRDRSGTEHRHEITLTVFRDDARATAPFLILNHGRPGSAAAMVRFGRARYAANSAYFVKRGFAVFVPTRIGYGVTGGADVEESGVCGRRYFARSSRLPQPSHWR